MAARGYVRSADQIERHARRCLDALLPATSCPDGYRLQSLADENDLARLDRVLWRGFDHPGVPPAVGIAGRARQQRTPHYRKDLNVVVVAADGSYASYAGIWYVPEHRVANVEPVATDPDHRGRGLGRAAVTEALRRAQQLGATVAWVGSDRAFYLALGFEVVASSTLWRHELEGARS